MYASEHMFLKPLNPCSSRELRDQISSLCKTNSGNAIYI
jgi:hypothetical protein